MLHKFNSAEGEKYDFLVFFFGGGGISISFHYHYVKYRAWGQKRCNVSTVHGVTDLSVVVKMPYESLERDYLPR